MRSDPITNASSATPSGETARFIVQEIAAAGDRPELFAEELGGDVVRQIGIIGGFIADLPCAYQMLRK